MRAFVCGMLACVHVCVRMCVCGIVLTCMRTYMRAHVRACVRAYFGKNFSKILHSGNCMKGDALIILCGFALLWLSYYTQIDAHGNLTEYANDVQAPLN